jgi:hypothetical protein
MQRVEMKIRKFKTVTASSVLGSVITIGAAAALATNCVFPPSLQGEWQAACSIFSRGAKKLTFARSQHGTALVQQNGQSCSLVERFDQNYETYSYKVESQSDCSHGASSNLVATYVFLDGETRLDVLHHGVTEHFFDCKLYEREKLASREAPSYAPR